MITSETEENFFSLLKAETTFVRTPKVSNQKKFFPPPQYTTSLVTNECEMQLKFMMQGSAESCVSDWQDLELVSYSSTVA